MNEAYFKSPDIAELVKLINLFRLQNKNEWYVVKGEYGDEAFSFKAYGTWIQRLNYKGFTDSGPSDCNVTEFKSYLINILMDTY